MVTATMKKHPAPFHDERVRKLWDQHMELVKGLRVIEEKHGLRMWDDRLNPPAEYAEARRIIQHLLDDEDRMYEVARREIWRDAAADLYVFLRAEGGSATFTALNTNNQFSAIRIYEPDDLALVPNVEVRRAGAGYRVWLIGEA